MSITIGKRTHAHALADAQAFRALFDPSTFLKWEFAGSIRRRRPDVGDVDHVIMPAFGEIKEGLFGQSRTVNLFLRRCDEIFAAGEITKHVYRFHPKTHAPQYRWGEKLRGADFRGFNHEMSLADDDNYGATLAIKTGPAEFSQQLVMGLRRRNRRNHDGYVWECISCDECEPFNPPEDKCVKCQGTCLMPVTKLPAGDERHYFELCGVPWTQPEDRR